MMNKNGILHKLMLVVILIAGFGLAFALPPLRRNADNRHAKEALATMQSLAQQEQLFYEQHGFYTADMRDLYTPKSCHPEVKEGHSVLACAGYDISLEEAHVLRASSTKYPQWFTRSVEASRTDCEFDTQSPVGERLCAAVHLR